MEFRIIKPGTIIIGTTGDGIVNVDNPKIKGKIYGVQNVDSDGIIKFYDGIITGATSNSISGNITEQENGYDIIKTSDAVASTESAILKRLTIASITEANVVSANLDEIEYTYESGRYEFYSISDAVNVCADNVNTTITLTRDVIFTSSHASETIPSEKNINLDLNGKTMSIANENAIVNNGALKILDSSETKTSIINCGNQNIFNNTGIIDFEEIQYTNNVKGTSEQEDIDAEKKSGILNNGIMNLNGGSFKNSEPSSQIIKNEGTLKITDSTLTSSRCIYNTGELNINSAVMNGILYNIGTGTIEIAQITMNSSIINYGTNVYEEGVSKPAVKITGGTLRSSVSRAEATISNHSGEIIIDNAQESTLKITAGGQLYKSIYNYADGKMIINDVTINEYGITNYGIIDMKSTIINSGIVNYNKMMIVNTTVERIENYSSAVMDIVSGSISNWINNRGVINIGKDDGIINISNPMISGNGVNNEGTLNYYDGTIMATTAVKGKISNVPENYDIIYTNDGIEKLIIGKTTAVASIGSTNYDTLKAAIASCSTSENTVIKILKPIAIPNSEKILISSTQNITLDLNGNDIVSYYLNNGIVNEGKLIITDTSTETNGKITGQAQQLINNKGTFNLNNGRLQTLANYYDKIVILNENTGTIEMNGGIIDAYVEDNSRAVQKSGTAIKSIGTGDITIRGGEIYLEEYKTYFERSIAIYIDNPSTTVTPKVIYTGDAKIINNSTKNNTYGIMINQGADLLVSGGNIEAFYAIDVGDNENITKYIEVEINAGTVMGQIKLFRSNSVIKGTCNLGYVITNTNGTLLIEDGNITQLNCTGVTKMINGSIINSTDVSVINKGTLEIIGGLIKGKTGINNQKILNLKGGTIIGETESAIYTNGNSVTNIGTKEDPVKIDYPNIIGTKYGIQGVYKNFGTINFYDGIIKGGMKAINGTIDETPELYYVAYEDNTETTAYLKINGTVEKVAKIGTLYYDTIAGALEAIKSSGGTGTIEITKDIIIDEPIIIEEGTNVTIDLQVHTIKSINTENGTIINNGTLNIIDTLENGITTLLYGAIENIKGVAIENNGFLNIGVNDSNVWTNSPRIIGETYGIVNGTEATLNFYDGIIKGITGVINGTITSITNQTGYTEQDGTYVEGEGEEAITYLTKYLGI